MRLCRQETSGTCVDIPLHLFLAPGSDGAGTDTLPPALASGAPRQLTYFVELKNRNGRSAGLSNPALVLAGEAPPPVTGLAATVIKAGVVLRWTPGRDNTAVRLQRKLLTRLIVRKSKRMRSTAVPTSSRWSRTRTPALRPWLHNSPI